MRDGGNRAPMTAATGRGLRIAVIDSGVNVRHPHISATTHGVVFGSESDDSSSDDPIGHGTAVMAAIQEKAPAAEYFALKLFGASLRTTTGRLIEAIEWTIENRMDVVNLSLGTSNFDYRDKLQSLVERAAAAAILLVSARSAGPNPVLPGVLQGVIAVDVDWDLTRDRYRVSDADGSPYFLASAYPRPLPGVPPSRNLNGISFAVANMTGFVAQACEARQSRSFREICEALAGQALTRAC
jgi:subtilisin family serine protease